MNESDANTSAPEADRLASWYRYLDQKAEELRRKEQEGQASTAVPAEVAPQAAPVAPQATPAAPQPAPVPPAPAPARAAAAPPQGAPTLRIPTRMQPAAQPAPAPASATAATAEPPPAAPQAHPAAAPLPAIPPTAPAPRPPAPSSAPLPAAAARAEETPALPGLSAGEEAPESAVAAVPAPAAEKATRPRRRLAPRRPREDGTGPDPVEAGAVLGLDPSVLEPLSPRVRGLLLQPESETAQHYYTKEFTETRAKLIGRLLDPQLTLEETARLLNVCPMTVRRYTNRGVLPHFRTPGDQRRFRLSDVLAFMEGQGRPTGPDSGEEGS